MEEYHMKHVDGPKNIFNAMLAIQTKCPISFVTLAHWKEQFRGASAMIVTSAYVTDVVIRAPEDGAKASSAVLIRIRRFTGAKTVS